MIDNKKNRFSGMCIGGPMDGQMLEHSTEIFQVNVEQPGRVPKSSAFRYGSVEATNFSRKEYKFTTGVRGTFNIDFWLYDGMSLEEAFTQIITVYASVNRKRSVAK